MAYAIDNNVLYNVMWLLDSYSRSYMADIRKYAIRR